MTISPLNTSKVRRPSWLRRLFAKWALLAYRLGLGPLIAGKVLVLTTRGTKTGRLRKAALLYVQEERVIFCFSRRGASSQWLKNLEASPNVWLRIERVVWQAQGQLVQDSTECERVLAKFQSKYRASARLLLQGDRASLVAFTLLES